MYISTIILLTITCLIIFIKYNEQLSINSDLQIKLIEQKYSNYTKKELNLGILKHTNYNIVCIKTLFNDINLMNYHNFLINDNIDDEYLTYINNTNTSDNNKIKSYLNFYGDCKYNYAIIGDDIILKRYLTTLFSYESKYNKLNIIHFMIKINRIYIDNILYESFYLIYYYEIINDDYYYMYSSNNNNNNNNLEIMSDNYIQSAKYISTCYDIENILREYYYRVDDATPIQSIMYKQKINNTHV